MKAYERFRNACKNSRKADVAHVTIEKVELKSSSCIIKLPNGSRSNFPIFTVITYVLNDGAWIVTNPSAIKQWKGWNNLDNYYNLRTVFEQYTKMYTRL